MKMTCWQDQWEKGRGSDHSSQFSNQGWLAFKCPKEMISCLSRQYSGLHLSPTTSTLPLPSVSLIGALSANYYTYLISLDLPTILAFSLPSTLLPVDPLPLLGSMTLVYHHLAYIPPPIGFYHPLISSYNDCGNNRSFPHATSYFRSIGSHDLPILWLASSSPPSSFNLDCSFLIR